MVALPELMNELQRALPDVDVLLALEPEELGAKILFLLRKEMSRREMSGVRNASFHLADFREVPYPREHRDEVLEALGEAWVWLEVQILLGSRVW